MPRIRRFIPVDSALHIMCRGNNKQNIFNNHSDKLYYWRLLKLYGYWGHIWQGRYKSNIIETDSYLLHCGKYIELNPVRAGIVSQPHEYAFSSYKHYSLGYPDALISDSPVFLGLADNSPKRREQYIAFVVDSGIINTDSLAKQAFIGSKDFINKFQGRAAKEGKNLEASPGFVMKQA